MENNQPILLIDDDTDDHDLLNTAMKEINISHPLIWFSNTKEAYDYLINAEDQPFLIFCDINMPGENGIEFKLRLNENEYLHKKSIPFLFYSTIANKSVVEKAYTELTVQGFFEKSTDFAKMKTEIKCILDYWILCKHPNEFS